MMVSVSMAVAVTVEVMVHHHLHHGGVGDDGSDVIGEGGGSWW